MQQEDHPRAPRGSLVSNAVSGAFALLASLAVGACGPRSAAPSDEEPPAAGRVAAEQKAAPGRPPDAGPIPQAWVSRRAAAAQQRLEASESGALLWKAIEAHGGLGRWLGKGTVSFTFDYAPHGQPERRMYTANEIDLWRARGFQRELGEGADAEFGWDGQSAWIRPAPDAFPTPARFWALTPYYFVGMPFVLADPGARYERLPDVELDGTAYSLVKVTYEAGTGDSPDDFYVVYLDKATHRVGAIRYIVAYPGFYAAGEHSPEKLMKYRDLREVDGLLFAHRLETHRYAPDTGEVGEQVTLTRVAALRVGAPIPAARFRAPAGAVESELARP